MEKFKCVKCGHEWIPRIEEKPQTCPKCKTYKWEDKERTNAAI